MLNNSIRVTILCSHIYPSQSYHPAPGTTRLHCTELHCEAQNFPTLWKLLPPTDAHANHPGVKASPSSITHWRTQYSWSRAQYFLTETKACCRLEEKEVVSFHTPSPSINQDALQIILKCYCFFFVGVGFFVVVVGVLPWNILSPSLRSREGPWDFAMHVFVSAFFPAWSLDKVLLTHPVRECSSRPQRHEALRSQ